MKNQRLGRAKYRFFMFLGDTSKEAGLLNFTK
jgi:hypothetical protein